MLFISKSNPTIQAIQQMRLLSAISGFVTLLPFGSKLYTIARKLFRKSSEKRPISFGLNVLLHRLRDAEITKDYLIDKVYLEIGPGDNFSGPIAAVALGAKKSIAIDAYDYTDFSLNSEIIDYFRQKKVSEKERLDQISYDLKKFSKSEISEFFSYFAPWEYQDISPGSVDIITSVSTMEHVQVPNILYQNCYYWLKPGGVMIHKIDFSSHGLTKDWFGHLLLPNTLFKITNGKKTSHINRWTEKQHLECCARHGFQLEKRIEFCAQKRAPIPFQNLPIAATHIWRKKNRKRMKPIKTQKRWNTL